MIIENLNKVRLCRAGSCCLTVEKTEDSFLLTDDYGGKLTVPLSELKNIKFEEESGQYRVSGEDGSVVFTEEEKEIFLESTLPHFKSE